MFNRAGRAGLLAAAVVVGTAALPTSSAWAQPTACPDAFPTSSAVDGVTGTGYTVERGTAPEPFSATLLGRIKDGIAPGVDMIMADVSSPAITRAGGVWAGMSGSPVYASDGRLIGAIAYGLAPSSPIAGITPAEDMKDLLAHATATRTRAKVAVNRTTAARLARTGDVTAAAAAEGFQKLPVPIVVSGALPGHRALQQAKLRKAFPGAIVSTGSAAGTSAAPSDIVAGGNFAGALSYGALTLAGVGTTTFVCSGKAVAFGHPFLHLGQTSMTAHPAEAVLVQPDAGSGPFKVANVDDAVGTVTQDRLAGIRGTLGSLPKTTLVSTTLSVPGGAASTLKTRAVTPEYLSTVAAQHALVAVDKRLDAIGPGSADVTIRIAGTRKGGAAFRVTRSDHFADPADISVRLADEAFALVDSITSQPFEDVQITGVSIEGSVQPKLAEYRVSSVKVKVGGTYVTPRSPIVVKAGSTMPFQVKLAPYRSNGSPRTVSLGVTVPTNAKGAEGQLLLSAGAVAGEEAEPKSLGALLAVLRAAPTNDGVRAVLSVVRPSGSTATVREATQVDASVAPYETALDVIVR